MNYKKSLPGLFALILVLFFTTVPVNAQEPVVRAVLFFSPTCPGCHIVMEEVLPPLADQYLDKLDIVGIDVNEEAGLNLFYDALDYYQVSDDRIGVPMLIIGDQVMVGPEEISQTLPGLIEKWLAAGGVDWPSMPGIRELIAAQPETSSPQTPATPSKYPAFINNFLKDPIANSIAVVVLAGMLVSLIGASILFLKEGKSKWLQWPKYILPILAVIGLGVALYLSYIEMSKTDAICGPVGDCNSVQESPYAYLFGVIPVGVIGAVGYIGILAAWLLQQYGPSTLKNTSTLAVWGMALFGLLFTIYLTYLEPFVIGATCAWCITSALAMTLIFWAATGPAKEVWQTDDFDDEGEEETDSEDALEEHET